MPGPNNIDGNLVLAAKPIGNDVFVHIPSTAFIAVAHGNGFVSNCVNLSVSTALSWIHFSKKRLICSCSAVCAKKSKVFLPQFLANNVGNTIANLHAELERFGGKTKFPESNVMRHIYSVHAY